MSKARCIPELLSYRSQYTVFLLKLVWAQFSFLAAEQVPANWQVYNNFFSHFFPLKNIIFLYLTDAKFHLFLFRPVWKQALRIRLTLPYCCTGFIKSLFWANEQRPVEHYLALGNLSLGIPSCFKIKAMQIFASFFLLMWTYFIKACKLFNYTLWI